MVAGLPDYRGCLCLERDARNSRLEAANSFDAATGQMIEHFSRALTQFEDDVRAGKANVHVVHKGGAGGHSGGGAQGVSEILALFLLLASRSARVRACKNPVAEC